MSIDPFCHWCNLLTHDHGAIPDGEVSPFDNATVDHLVSRFFREKGTIVPKVLACDRCNKKRAEIENAFFERYYNLHDKYRKQKEYVQSI